jgi:nitrogen regulatory protein PII
MKPQNKTEEWEKEFDEFMIDSKRVAEIKGFGELENYNLRMRKIKFFISSLLQKQREEIVEEVEKMTIPHENSTDIYGLERQKAYKKALKDIINQLTPAKAE